MARKYDIVDRLKSKNERPVVILDEDHKFPIDTSMVKGFTIMGLSKKVDESDDPQDYLDQIIKIALGEKALEYVKDIDITMEALMLVMETIMAAYSGRDLENEENQKK